MKSETDNILNQGIGAYIDYINSLKADELQKVLSDISNKLNKELLQEDINIIKALSYVKNVRDFISNPDQILGSNLTKHGEIAEQVEVNISNARRVLNGLKESFTFNGVERTAPEDYLYENQAVQSKFYNGLNNTLRAILEHNEKYKYFGADGNSYYNIPKDYYNTIQDIISGNNIDNINEKTIKTAKKLIEEIENKTNKSFNQVVKPSISNYSDVQLGKIDKTLDNEEVYLRNKSETNKEFLKNKAKNDKIEAINETKPSIAEAFKVAGVAAFFGGATRFAIGIYQKKKDGKNISEFTFDDWKELGLDTAKGGGKGALSGISIYSLTNFTNTPAPLASAYVSAIFGITKLSNDYRSGNISSNEFIENSEIICIDSALSAIGAGLGAVMIPVPVLGSVIGSIVANTMSSIAKDYLGKKEQELISYYNKRFMMEISKIDKKYTLILSAIMQEYYKLGEITNMAFDFSLNSKLRFKKSIELARAYNVDENEILKNKDDICKYFLN